MTTPSLPGRRSFLRLIGLFCAAPAIAHPTTGNRRRSNNPQFNPEGPEWLLEWKKIPRYPVTTSADPVTVNLLQAIDAGDPLPIFYHGGSQPGRLRNFSPGLVFRPQGVPHTYVSGFCHLRSAPRTLRVDRIGLA